MGQLETCNKNALNLLDHVGWVMLIRVNDGFTTMVELWSASFFTQPFVVLQMSNGRWNFLSLGANNPLGFFFRSSMPWTWCTILRISPMGPYEQFGQFWLCPHIDLREAFIQQVSVAIGKHPWSDLADLFSHEGVAHIIQISGRL